MSILLDDIKTQLDVATTGGATGWVSKLSYLPPTPDKIVAVYEEPSSQAPEQEWAIDYESFRVIVRGTKKGYEVARAKMKDVFDALHAQETSIGGDYVFVYADSSSPLYLGLDENDRPLLSLGFRVMKDRT